MVNVSLVHFDTPTNAERLYLSYCISAFNCMDANVKVWQITEGNCFETTSAIKASIPELIICFINITTGHLLGEFGRCLSDDYRAHVTACFKIPTLYYNEMLEEYSFLDSVIIGEFDETVRELGRVIAEKGHLHSCRGIAYRDGSLYKLTEKRRTLDNIDELPFPDRSRLYQEHLLFHVLGSRGCEGHCTFCDENVLYSNKVRYRSITNIMDEIDNLVYKHNCKFVAFSDPSFCNSENRFQRLEELYIQLSKRDYWIQFYMNLRAEVIDDALVPYIKKLTEVGLGKIFVGIESFNDADLKLYGKLADMKKNINTISILNKIPSLELECGNIWFQPYTSVEGLLNNVINTQKMEVPIHLHQMINKVRIYSCTTLTKKIMKDGLLDADCNQSSKRFSFKYNYKFKSNEVATIYNCLLECMRIYPFAYSEWEPFIVQRYTHFFGTDALANRINEAYDNWVTAASNYCLSLLEELLTFGLSSKIDPYELALRRTQEFIDQSGELYNIMKRSITRATIQLSKYNEMIYK
ncbi:hypothetical protein JHL18_11725 [Clostridium sp. YIM B02505]|uniref:Elp3/MiaA/NifB-like radical SAM core domain-containing protein n=1 Tax=Clostridium yunnanense TaxID=2800325 RepID=A0ABS1EPL4_9CLOT|nr:radical SAM protein [Clostridium yunnanense]MBK1811295.1 hypothetical protein [Clostridium yunnanense]